MSKISGRTWKTGSGDGRPAARGQLLDLFHAALAAVHGGVQVGNFLRQHPLSGTVYLIAVGKAACPMARAAGEMLGAQVRDAWVVTKAGYGEDLPWKVRETGHPLPDARSIEAGADLLDFIRRLPGDATVVVLLSGGASALVECPVSGIGLAELQAVNEWLLGSGIGIAGVNAVRRRLSRIKGGGLAALLAPRRVLCLAISDVPGNDRLTIASGMLVHAPHPLRALPADIPSALRTMIGKAAPAAEVGMSAFRNVRYHIIASPEDAVRAAAGAACDLGYRVYAGDQIFEGDAVHNGQRFARELLDGPEMAVHVWGGESSVRLPPCPGRGGRNQSLALAAATLLAGHDDVFLLAAGTDGSDGPGDDAGALVDSGTIERGYSAGFDAQAAITGADAGSFLEASADLLYTGPTGTNVADIVIGLRTDPHYRN